jgi:hypothetical protein
MVTAVKSLLGAGLNLRQEKPLVRGSKAKTAKTPNNDQPVEKTPKKPESGLDVKA